MICQEGKLSAVLARAVDIDVPRARTRAQAKIGLSVSMMSPSCYSWVSIGLGSRVHKSNNLNHCSIFLFFALRLAQHVYESLCISSVELDGHAYKGKPVAVHRLYNGWPIRKIFYSALSHRCGGTDLSLEILDCVHQLSDTSRHGLKLTNKHAALSYRPRLL